MSAETHEEPLSTFTLIVIGLEMLAVAAILYYACTEPANVGHPGTWFGERVAVAPSSDSVNPPGPKGK